jgi:excisionase family DNA binding protein
MIHQQNLAKRLARDPHSPAAAPQGSDELLQYYLELPAKEREKQFANTADAAELIGRSQRTIQRWIEAGLIRAVSIVGRELVLIPSLREFVQRQSQKHA